MYSIIGVNEHLANNVDDITNILEGLEMSNITYNPRRHEIRCSREAGRNPTSVCINTETLFYKCFSTNKKGSIVSLVMDRKQLSFRYALEWIGDRLGLEGGSYQNQTIQLPFGGFYKNIIHELESPEANMEILPESILSGFNTPCPNMMFLKDGISIDSQAKYLIGYDIESGRITIPQRDIYGNLVGVMGRMNSSICDYSERWYPVISCPRSLTLFGYAENIRNIDQGGGCVLVESEKSVMQMDSMGFKFGLATCTNTISDVQAKIIKGNSASLNSVVIAFDEGLDESLLREAAKKLQMRNQIYRYKVGYIFDKEHELMPRGSKCSPTGSWERSFYKVIKRTCRVDWG